MNRKAVVAAALLLASVSLAGRAWLGARTAPRASALPVATARATAIVARDAPVEPTSNGQAPAAPSIRDVVAARELGAPKPSEGRTPESNDVLLGWLSSSDEFAVLDAANALARKNDTRALPSLEEIDITKAPNAAPSVIDALGHLAGLAAPASRTAATDRLLALLARERARNAPESGANLLSLYAALGETLDPRAATALEGVLLDPAVTLAAKTVVVDALTSLKESSSVGPLRTLASQLATTPDGDGDALDAEVRRELLAAVARALRTIG